MRFPLFDDRFFFHSFPPISEWEGEGLDKDIGAEAAGKILYEYAKICAPTVCLSE